MQPNAEWTEEDATTVTVRWWDEGTTQQAPSGTYALVLSDLEGNSDSLTTPFVPQASADAPNITYPLEDSLISDTAPTSTWDAYPGATMYSIYLSDAMSEEEVWSVRGDIPGEAISADYNYDGAALLDELLPGRTYSLFLDTEVLVDYFVSDPRVYIAFYPATIIRFTIYSPNPVIVDVDIGREPYDDGQVLVDRFAAEGVDHRCG